MQRASALFRLLADGTRLRLLRVLAQDRFNVSELTGILGVAQSGVSRHLGLLKDAGLVTEEREGGYAYYRLSDEGGDDGQGPPSHRTVPDRGRHRARLRDGVEDRGRHRARLRDPGSPPRTLARWRGGGVEVRWGPRVRALLDAQFADSSTDPAVREDESRLQEVLRHRKENFETHGDVRQLVPGRSWAAWARAIGHLLPPLDVADIGCGEGYLTLEAARWARTVVGIDRSDEILERAKALAARRRVTNVLWKQGDLARLPLRDASVDVSLLSQSLHHASDPEEALAEAARVLKPGGRLLVLDLREHDQTWVRSRFGDQRLGFADAELERLLAGAGLRDVRVQVGTRQAGDPFVVLIASGRKGVGGHFSRMPPPRHEKVASKNDLRPHIKR